MTDFDIIIIGAGPAGLTAAQYGARANLKVLVIEKLSYGGQALVIDVLENYPGFLEQKSGFEFAVNLHQQAENFGAVFLSGSVCSLKKENGIFLVNLEDGSILRASAVIMATGAKPRLLDVPGEKEFSRKGVSYCATCDGNFFKGKKIFVVGGGDAACDEARYLSRLTDKVILIHRRDSFRAQKSLVERTLKNPNITVRYNTIIKEIKGDNKVKSVILADTVTANTDVSAYEEETDAVFIFAGTVPQVSLVSTADFKIELDENGYIITDQKMATNITGLFAAGDVRSGVFRQVVTAAADGATAAHNAAGYLDAN
ncbi:MAG: thioredoxin-disulfide reductase [Treponema sp.]|nr:thioredoxin-disulfide reductase [Treponema sp.]